MLTKHREYNDEEFLTSLEDSSIPPDLFSHEAHLRMAWLYINQNDNTVALEKISEAIKGLDNKHSEGKNYHHTKTVAFMRIIGSIMKKKDFPNWQLFIRSNRDLVFSKKTLEYYYSDDILNGAVARVKFVEPDINPLPDF